MSIRSAGSSSRTRFPLTRNCESGPAVRLSRYNVWAVAWYEEVYAILNDWQTFCSSRGAGLSDFAKEKPWRPKSLVLETDPPLHDRTRRVMNSVLSASVMTPLRERFAEEADALIAELVERTPRRLRHRPRLEGEWVLSALARKAGSIEITGPVRRRYNNTLRALATLPVTVRREVSQ